MFKKAKKEQRKLRIIIAAPSGGGKTYTALKLASGILSTIPDKGNGRIALIDTENHSSSNYARLFDFDVADIQPPYQMKDFIQTINFAKDQQYPVLILDSGSHVWKHVLNVVDNIASTSKSGNSYAAWKTGDKVLDQFLSTLLYYPGHIIMCLRSKMEYVMQQNEKGKTDINKVGLAPQMRNGIEYEFDFMLDGTLDHFFTVTKTRYAEFDGMIVEKPDEKFGVKLAEYILDNDIEEIPADMPNVTINKNREMDEKEKQMAESYVKLFHGETEVPEESKPLPDNKKYNVEGGVLDLTAALPYSPANIKPEFKQLCGSIMKGWQMLGYHDNHIISSLEKHLGVKTLASCEDLKALHAYYTHLREEYKNKGAK